MRDDELRWLYDQCQGLVAASYEDFGLTPLEAAVFGKPSVVLAWGGFLDTVVDGLTGAFFARPEPQLIARTLRDAARTRWNPSEIRRHSQAYDVERFRRRLHDLVTEEACSV